MSAIAIGQRQRITPHVRTNGMAVRAHQFALRDLIQNALAPTSAGQKAEIFGLLKAGKVIPLHCCGMEHAAAVRTGLALLEADVPRHERQLPALVLLLPTLLIGLVVGGRVGRRQGLHQAW